jgi:D-beta-D-heptose 7-phosphate kinase/D-beta-D-heptose 1-phosphate adenosyltransferase
MRNIVSLGGKAVALGLIGDDAGGASMRTRLDEVGVDTAGLLTVPNRATTEKTRVIAEHQQVVRIDQEECDPLAPDQVDAMMARLRQAAADDGIDAVILEDYNKGVLGSTLAAEVQHWAAEQGVPCLLDPHPLNPLQLDGLTLATPNRNEALALGGLPGTDAVLPVEADDNLVRAAAALQQQWSPDALLITLGEHGMALFEADAGPVHIPVVARAVFDVTGAGDTVIATCCLALLAGGSTREAAELANHAAGVVVGRVGTVSVTCEELRRSFEQAEHD